jgi:hypothetical protein
MRPWFEPVSPLGQRLLRSNMSSGLVGLVSPVVNDRIVIEALYAAMGGLLSSLDHIIRLLLRGGR